MQNHAESVNFQQRMQHEQVCEFLHEVFVDVAKAGADRLDIPDTVGYSTPQYMAQIVRETIDATKLPVSVHCHNDFGLAVANHIWNTSRS